MTNIETKTKILDAAERLFCEQGLDGTSLRAIIAEAGVNLAAVNYHFQSKERLIREVFKRRIKPLNKMRLEMLNKSESKAGGKPLNIEEILSAFIEPVFRIARKSPEEGIRTMQLTMQAIALPSKAIENIHLLLFEDIMVRFHIAFEKSLPHLSEEEFAQRMSFVVSAFAFTFLSFARRGNSDNHRFAKSELSKMGKHFTSFAAAGLMAPAIKS